MIGEKRCFEILKSALNYAGTKKVDYVEFLLISWENFVTRAANSQIHQNVGEIEASLGVDIIHNLRIGSASTNLLTTESIQKTIDVAMDSTHHKAQLPAAIKLDEFPKGVKKGRFSENTAEFSPQDRAAVLKEIIDVAKSSGLMTSAKFQTGSGEIAIANNKGTLVYTSFTDANLSAILTGKIDSAYGTLASQEIVDLNFPKFAEELVGKCRLQNRQPVDLFANKKPGEEVYFDVILEPAAVAEWLEFLSYTGFNGLSYHEDESFLCGRMGEKVMGENVTIWDDGSDPRGYLLPFDFEGTPKSRLDFIRNGIGRNVAYDGFLAAKENKKTTGHSLGAGQRHMGPLPLNLFMEGGEQSLDYMIASSEDPTIYVTRFHYTNIADRKNVVLTGMTKDGTFLVEKGEIVAPAVNLRYLQSVVEAFNNVEMLSEPLLVHDPAGYGALIPSSTVAPALKIKKVRFTGSTGS
jgi:predicted Zn-dependent protease